jgi:hypothetical protein
MVRDWLVRPRPRRLVPRVRRRVPRMIDKICEDVSLGYKPSFGIRERSLLKSSRFSKSVYPSERLFLAESRAWKPSVDLFLLEPQSSLINRNMHILQRFITYSDVKSRLTTA